MVGVRFGVAVAFSVLIAAARLLRKHRRRVPPLGADMNLDSRGLQPTTSIPFNPRIVRLFLYTDRGKCQEDIGVIVFSDGQSVKILGRAYFLYSSSPFECGSREFHQGQVMVALQSNENSFDGPTFQAVVVHVDFFCNVAVLKFTCSMRLPIADYCTPSDLSIGQQLVSTNLGVSMQHFHETHTIRSLPDGGICGDLFHVDMPSEMGSPGVFDFDGKLIGFRMLCCPHDKSLGHGISFDYCTKLLELSEKMSVDCRTPLVGPVEMMYGVPIHLHAKGNEEDMFSMLHDMKEKIEIMRMHIKEIASAPVTCVDCRPPPVGLGDKALGVPKPLYVKGKEEETFFMLRSHARAYKRNRFCPMSTSFQPHERN